jgi:AraC family transcriptional regulator
VFPSIETIHTSGTIVRRREVAGFILTERVYRRGLEIAEHRHEHAYLSLVLSGSYTERHGETTVDCFAGALRFLPAFAPHSNLFPEETRCLLVRVESATLPRLEQYSPLLRKPGAIHTMASAWLAKRLYSEFSESEDGSSALALEGIVLEILAEGSRTSGGPTAVPMPRWLRRVHEFLEISYRDNLSLQEIASVGQVHPVHLAREFRRFFHCSIGEFLRRKRIRQACQMLAESNVSIAEIAQACGFSDQSHFSSAFKRQAGLTPGKFRQLA